MSSYTSCEPAIRPHPVPTPPLHLFMSINPVILRSCGHPRREDAPNHMSKGQETLFTTQPCTMHGQLNDKVTVIRCTTIDKELLKACMLGFYCVTHILGMS